MKCSRCGAENQPGSVVCAACGTPLVQAPVTPVVPGQPVFYAAPTVPGKGLAIASMVLGIISLALFCFWYLAMACAVIGCILGGVSMAKQKQAGMKFSGMAIAGLVCSLIALGVSIIACVWACAVLNEAANTINKIGYYY